MPSARLINFPTYNDSNGTLAVQECGKHVPFEIQRVFTISANTGDIRGNHAHKQCTQLLVCIVGKICVTCDDGSLVTEHILDTMGIGLLIPPGVWAKQEYLVDGSVLMVLCDSKYVENDYLRDYKEFQLLIGAKG